MHTDAGSTLWVLTEIVCHHHKCFSSSNRIRQCSMARQTHLIFIHAPNSSPARQNPLHPRRAPADQTGLHRGSSDPRASVHPRVPSYGYQRTYSVREVGSSEPERGARMKERQRDRAQEIDRSIRVPGIFGTSHEEQLARGNDSNPLLACYTKSLPSKQCQQILDEVHPPELQKGLRY